MNIPFPEIAWSIPKVYVLGCAVVLTAWFLRGSHKHGALDYVVMFALVVGMILVGAMLFTVFRW